VKALMAPENTKIGFYIPKQATFGSDAAKQLM